MQGIKFNGNSFTIWLWQVKVPYNKYKCVRYKDMPALNGEYM